jgi:hypothetical protein
MHLYLDESGDTGFKFQQGSSRYFVAALIVVRDPDALAEVLEEQRFVMRKSPGEELKFARLHHDGRHQVLRALAIGGLDARVLVVDKHRLTAPETRSRDGFYKYLIGATLAIDFSDIERARLVVDESFKSKAKQADLATHIRQALNTNRAQKVKRIRDIVYRASHREPCLQIADLVAGAVARAYEGKDLQYRRIIEQQIIVLDMP